MNLAANWQGAAKKCELSVGSTLHTREKQHAGWLSVSSYKNVLQLCFDFDVYLKESVQIFQELSAVCSTWFENAMKGSFW